MSDSKLEELQQEMVLLQERIERIQKEERGNVINRILEEMQKYGITADDLKIRRRRAAPKYRDPISGKTWSGQGRKPRWIEDGLAAGKSLESFLI